MSDRFSQQLQRPAAGLSADRPRVEAAPALSEAQLVGDAPSGGLTREGARLRADIEQLLSDKMVHAFGMQLAGSRSGYRLPFTIPNGAVYFGAFSDADMTGDATTATAQLRLTGLRIVASSPDTGQPPVQHVVRLRDIQRGTADEAIMALVGFRLKPGNVGEGIQMLFQHAMGELSDDSGPPPARGGVAMVNRWSIDD